MKGKARDSCTCYKWARLRFLSVCVDFPGFCLNFLGGRGGADPSGRRWGCLDRETPVERSHHTQKAQFVDKYYTFTKALRGSGTHSYRYTARSGETLSSLR